MHNFPLRRLQKFAHAEDGQALIMTAVALLSLIGCLALATDVGVLYRSRTNLQKVADAAAVAGASELLSGNWSAAAQGSALQNGVNCAATGVTCTISIGTSAHPSAVSVYITQPESTYFLPVFGKSAVTIGARAAAGIVAGQVCMTTLDNDATAPQGYGVTINGGGNGTGLTAPQCTLTDNAGLALNGSAQLITDGGTGIHDQQVKGNGTASPIPVTGLNPAPDPLSGYWTAPTCTSSSGNLSVSTGNVSPGCYNNFSVTGTAALQPGLYIIQGDLYLTSTTAATGVTFYVDSANGGTLACQPSKCAFTTPVSSPNFTTGANGTCTTAGGCDGLLLWDTETTNSPKNVTIGSTSLTGVIYAPTVNLVLGGNTALTLDSNVVVGSITMNGTVTLTNYSAGQVASPLNSAALLE